jgi:putative SOS response-associated peptidase YedK
MCYEIVSATRAKLKYAQHRSSDAAEIALLEKYLLELEKDLNPFHHISGFAFPNVLVYTSVAVKQPQTMLWGLMPHWAKTKADAQNMQPKTLNARVESLTEKPAFKNIISNKCLVVIDGFFEHKLVGNKKYPHLITDQNEEPLSIGGLWDVWQNSNNENEKIQTVTFITAPANGFMAAIHNNGKMGEARMPLIIAKDLQDNWLHENKLNKLPSLIKETQKVKLKAHTVQKLSGKRALGNVVDATKKHEYPELNIIQKSLF